MTKRPVRLLGSNSMRPRPEPTKDELSDDYMPLSTYALLPETQADRLKAEEPEPSPTALYRLYGEDGSLLYAGISETAMTRFAKHAADKPWWPEVASIRLEHLETREAALLAEAEAIAAENPRYNVIRPNPENYRRKRGPWRPAGNAAELRDALDKQTRRHFDLSIDGFVEAWKSGEIDRDDERLRVVQNLMWALGIVEE